MRKKKKFKDTTVGKLALGAVSLINPTIANVLKGQESIEGALTTLTTVEAPIEDKIRIKELLIEAYEAEVNDRIAARNREAQVAASGGSDVLFKVVGFGITAAFITIVAGALGLWEIPEEQQRLYDMAFGAVVAQMTAVVSYYFGSSMGSKQKTHIIDGQSKQ